MSRASLLQVRKINGHSLRRPEKAPSSASCGVPQGKQRRVAAASSKGREALDTAKRTLAEGDRNRALQHFENAAQQRLSPEDHREVLYGLTAVHASYGNIEEAQMSLREGIEFGLDFEEALSNGNMPKWKSSPQVLAQLKKFARTLKQIKEAVAPLNEIKGGIASKSDGYGSPDRDRLPKPDSNMSLSEMLRTDITGMDATVTGIIKRVLLLLVIGLVLGTALFYIGLELSGIAH